MKRLYSALVVAMLFATTTVTAKTITLYSEPKADSKVSSTMNTETGVTIVYAPKSGDWIKVANPANGEVGWVKSNDLGDHGYNMRIFTSGDGSHSYNVYQIGRGHSQLNQQKLEEEMRYFEQQQRIMQLHMAQMFNSMFYFPQPIFVPVVMLPEQNKLQKKPTIKAASNNPNSSNTEGKKI